MAREVKGPYPAPSRFKWDRDGKPYQVMGLPQIGSTRPQDNGKRLAIIQALWDAREDEDEGVGDAPHDDPGGERGIVSGATELVQEAALSRTG